MSFPLPQGRATIVAGAPGIGLGNWAGAPGAALGSDGAWVLAYRVREGVMPESGASTVVAVSDDGETFSAVATVDESRFDAMSMERPSVVQLEDGGWRLYTCCATKGSKHWWIDALDADRPAGFASTDARTVFPGDDRTAVKDPICAAVSRLDADSAGPACGNVTRVDARYCRSAFWRPRHSRWSIA